MYYKFLSFLVSHMIKWEINFPKVDIIILHFTLILTSTLFPYVYVFIAPKREMFCVAEPDSLSALRSTEEVAHW